MRESVESSARLVTRSSMPPLWLIVPANNALPVFFSTGMDSPVREDSSTWVSPSVSTPSTAICSPGRTITVSPMPISSTATLTVSSPRRTNASLGLRVSNDSMARCVRSIAWRCSTLEKLNRNNSSAPSNGAPMSAAPRAANTISTSTSSTFSRNEAMAERTPCWPANR